MGKRTPKSDKLERRRLRIKKGTTRKVYEGATGRMVRMVPEEKLSVPPSTLGNWIKTYKERVLDVSASGYYAWLDSDFA